MVPKMFDGRSAGEYGRDSGQTEVAGRCRSARGPAARAREDREERRRQGGRAQLGPDVAHTQPARLCHQPATHQGRIPLPHTLRVRLHWEDVCQSIKGSNAVNLRPYKVLNLDIFGVEVIKRF